ENEVTDLSDDEEDVKLRYSSPEPRRQAKNANRLSILNIFEQPEGGETTGPWQQGLVYFFKIKEVKRISLGRPIIKDYSAKEDMNRKGIRKTKKNSFQDLKGKKKLESEVWTKFYFLNNTSMVNKTNRMCI